MVPPDAAPGQGRRRRSGNGPADAPTSPSLSIDQLAHELNSLLDGSLRTVGLAIRDLAASGRGRSLENVAERLQTAEDAMRQMADVLERAMTPQPGGSSSLLACSRTLGVEIEHVLALVQPMAHTHGVGLDAEVAEDAAEVSAGPLGAVLLNGLRNAVQACARRASGPLRVRLAARVEGDTLAVVITDTGVPGTGPGGHGLGLALSERIARELGGRLDLASTNDGATLRLEVPVPKADAA